MTETQKINSGFQTKCTNVINEIDEDVIEAYKTATDSLSRIRILYNIGQRVPIDLPDNGKNLEQAEKRKVEGNGFFGKQDYQNALRSYNKGILLCPQDTDKGREVLTLLVSNRSATYFELKEYKRVFDDIDYVIVIGNYPQHLQYKIWLRKAKCYDALQNEKLSAEAYQQAVKCLKLSKLDDKALENKLKEIENAKKKVMPPVHHSITPIRNPDPFQSGQFFIALSESATIKEDPAQGRYAVATKDIEPGTIILEELPHSFVIAAENRFTNCQNCSISISQPIPCSGCGHVAFCSTFCENIANSGFHKFECYILKILFDNKVSVNLLLSLRVITQKSLQYFKEKYGPLKEYLNDKCTKRPIKRKCYRFDDYETLFFLCRNESTRSKTDLVHLSVMAIYLARLLIMAKYFDDSGSENETLTKDQLYITALLQRHLEILQYNAHEISELRNVRGQTEAEGNKVFYDNHSLGAALYPTLALFNHSCDPSVIRYNIKSKIIVRAIKPIKAGDIIYENYGPLYMSTSAYERQDFLLKLYSFKCACKPCTEKWPKFEDIDYEQLRIRCKNTACSHVFTVRMNGQPMSYCPLCRTVAPVMRSLGALMTLDDILTDAEDCYMHTDFYDAMKVYIHALMILFTNIEPPHPEIIKIQQRIKACMLHIGSTAFDYVPKLE